MKKILIGMRGGLGDIILFTPVLEKLKSENEDAQFICGTSKSCEVLARSIPFFDDFIIDFRPRYVRRGQRGHSRYSYKDRRTGFSIDQIDDYYCLDHPYRDVSKDDAENVHIIDMAIKILGVNPKNRAGKIFLSSKNHDNADVVLENIKNDFVIIAPLCSQSIKIAPYGLMSAIADMFRENSLEPLCAIPDIDIPINAKKLCVKSVLDLSAVISRAKYFVGLDSGLSHIAAALRLPMSTIHIGYSVKRSGVLNSDANVMPFANRFIDEGLWKDIVRRISEHHKSRST